MENNARKNNWKIKKWLIIPFFTTLLMSQNVGAIALQPSDYIVGTTRNISSIRVGSTNYSFTNNSTGRQLITVSANSSANLSLSRFNLNQNLGYANNPNFAIEYQVNIYLPENTSVAAAATCLQGDYNYNFNITYCDNTIISQTSGAVIYRIVLMGTQSTSSEYNFIPTLSNFLTFTNASASSQNFYWEFIPIQVFNFRKKSDNAQLNDISTEIQQQNTTYTQESTTFTTTETGTNSTIDQGQTEINQGGTTLIGILLNFKTNVLDRIDGTADDCEINLGSPYGFNLGKIDLCYFSPPGWLTNMLNIVMSLALVGLAIHVFWRIINVIKGFAK